MASPTDLDGFLYGEGGFAEAIHAVLDEGKSGKHPLEGPFVVRCKYWAEQSSSHEVVSDFTIKDRASFHVDNVVKRVHADVNSVLGMSPIGRMDLRLWEDGLASSPIAKRIRTLTAPGYEKNTNQALLLRRLSRVESMTEKAFETLQLNNAQVMIMMTEVTKVLGTVATVRSTTGAANDLGGIMGIVSLVALFVGMPFINKMLKLPATASMQDTVEAAQRALAGAALPAATGGGNGVTVTAATMPESAGSPKILTDDGDQAEVDSDADPKFVELLALLHTPQGRERMMIIAQGAKMRDVDIWQLFGIDDAEAPAK